jgi:adenylyl-sulfate kinase
MEMQQGAGFVIWLTGMNRSGKSTLAAHLVQRLAAAGGRRAELLDEDGDAALLLEGLGPSKDDHTRAVARLGFVAKAVARSGGIAVCAALSPYREARDTLKREARRFVEVFVDCSMEKLQQRDPQGIYRRALAGELKDVPGVDVPYEPPTHADVTVHTDQLTVADAGNRVFQALVDGKLVGPAEFARITGGLRPKRARPERAVRGGGRRKLDARAAARKAPKKAAGARGARAAKPRR